MQKPLTFMNLSGNAVAPLARKLGIAPEAILVISDHQVRCHQAVEVVDQLKKCGSRILGVVRNNIHANGSGYYKKYYKNRYQ